MATATENQQSRFTPAPMNPDEFATGQPDNFIGTFIGAYAYPYKGKQSKDNRYYLYVAWVIQPDEDSGYDLFTESYSAGFLNQAIPSKDGATPAGASEQDYIDLASGKSPGLDRPCIDENTRMVIPKHDNVGEYVLGKLSKGRSYEQACIALRDSDTKSLVDYSKPGYLGFVNGLRCRFNRVPQTGGGQKKEGERDYKVLVPTEIFGRVDVKATGATSKAAKSSASSSADSNGDGDLESTLRAEIVDALKSAPENTLKTGVLMSSLAKKLKDRFKKAEVMGWISEASNYEGWDAVMLDEDEGELTLNPSAK